MNGASTEIGVLLEGNETKLPLQQIKATAVIFQGFDLVIAGPSEVRSPYHFYHTCYWESFDTPSSTHPSTVTYA